MPGEWLREELGQGQGQGHGLEGQLSQETGGWDLRLGNAGVGN